MNKRLAARIMKSANQLGGICNKMDPLLRQIGDDDEKNLFLRRLGKIMADINTGIVLPLIEKYPELDPDR